MYQVMIDIETMGQTPQSAICSIGAVKWNESEEVYFYQKISLASSVAAGGKMDASTVLWWMQQSEAARKEIIDANEQLPVVLLKLTDFVKDCIDIWAAPATFDLPIIENAYRLCTLPLPWSYKQHRCWSTLRKVMHAPKEPNFAEHNALADALCQAAALRKWQAVVK